MVKILKLTDLKKDWYMKAKTPKYTGITQNLRESQTDLKPIKKLFAIEALLFLLLKLNTTFL